MRRDIEKTLDDALDIAHDAGLELAAFCADSLAEVHRLAGISGRRDPNEAQMLDKHFAEFAEDLRRQKRAARHHTEGKGDRPPAGAAQRSGANSTEERSLDGDRTR